MPHFMCENGASAHAVQVEGLQVHDRASGCEEMVISMIIPQRQKQRLCLSQ